VGLESYFRDALAAIRTAPEFEQAISTAPADPLEHRRAIARAIVAHALVSAEEAGEPSIPGSVRDDIVERLTDELHGYGLGVGEFLLRPVRGLALRLVTRKLTGERGAITDAAAPAAGDVLRFLAAGDGIRTLLSSAVDDAGSGPVYLLAHSLGGIMCVDLLARKAIPSVAGLITVGSQSPFLYEIGALPSLVYPDALPNHFPTWVNIYDVRDLLSYVASRIWGNLVTDIKVDNGQPFPQSHSAYWRNPHVWDAIEALIRA
jgi:pimeloyl-ACP methyl ester carboxylesterase